MVDMVWVVVNRSQYWYHFLEPALIYSCSKLASLLSHFKSVLCKSRFVVNSSNMMLTQRLSVLAHDLAKQCQVTGQAKSLEERQQKGKQRKKSNHSLESEGSGESESML